MGADGEKEIDRQKQGQREETLKGHVQSVCLDDDDDDDEKQKISQEERFQKWKVHFDKPSGDYL